MRTLKSQLKSHLTSRFQASFQSQAEASEGRLADSLTSSSRRSANRFNIDLGLWTLDFGHMENVRANVALLRSCVSLQLQTLD